MVAEGVVVPDDEGGKPRSYYVPVSHQIKTLLKREVRLFVNSPGKQVARIVQCAIIATLCGALFFNLPQTFPSGVNNRTGIIFFGLIFIAMGALSSVPDLFLK